MSNFRTFQSSVIAILIGFLVSFNSLCLGAEDPPSQNTSGSNTNSSDMGCPNAHIIDGGLFTKPCWNAFLPVVVGGFPTFRSSVGYSAPSDANNNKVCACGGDLSTGKLPSVGTAVGMRLPTKLIEVVRRPYCFPSIEGKQATNSMATLGGERQIGGNIGSLSSDTLKHSGFYNWHFFIAPVMAIAKMMDIPTCNPGGYGSFQVAQLSESFPNWYKPMLNALITPEALLVAGPQAIPALIADCTAATASNEGFDWAFMAAGCWGMNYPFSGDLANNSNPVKSTRLITSKVISLLIRLSVPKVGLERTIGADAVCKPKPTWVIKKSQWQMQMMFPVSEAKGETPQRTAIANPSPSVANPAQVDEVDPTSITNEKQCTGPIGRSTMRTGDWRHIPAVGEDHVYLLWQWVDCCVGLLAPGS